MTDDVLVVLYVQMSHVVDLAKDALQLTVTDPGVEGHLKVGAGCLELQEGLEPDVL